MPKTAQREGLLNYWQKDINKLIIITTEYTLNKIFIPARCWDFASLNYIFLISGCHFPILPKISWSLTFRIWTFILKKREPETLAI